MEFLIQFTQSQKLSSKSVSLVLSVIYLDNLIIKDSSIRITESWQLFGWCQGTIYQLLS